MSMRGRVGCWPVLDMRVLLSKVPQKGSGRYSDFEPESLNQCQVELSALDSRWKVRVQGPKDECCHTFTHAHMMLFVCRVG